jgi:nitroreductase
MNIEKNVKVTTTYQTKFSQEDLEEILRNFVGAPSHADVEFDVYIDDLRGVLVTWSEAKEEEV